LKNIWNKKNTTKRKRKGKRKRKLKEKEKEKIKKKPRKTTSYCKEQDWKFAI
jgi:hypothetical protein